MQYSSIELELPRDCIEAICQPGSNDAAVSEWVQAPAIATQLCRLTPLDAARILYGYGAWDVSELADYRTNLERLLWLAAWDAYENDVNPDSATAWAMMEGHGYETELASLAA